MKRLMTIAALVMAAVSCKTGSASQEMIPVEYTLEKTIEVAGRQGVACDGQYYYVSSSTGLFKYSLDGELVAENATPFEGLELEANHIGDIDVYDNAIYAGIESFMDGVGENIQVAVYDAGTLQWKYSIPWIAESGQVEVCGLAVDAANGLVWMADWVQGHELYAYDLKTREYVGKMTLEPAPLRQQGIFCHKNLLLISSDDGDADNGEPDHIYAVKPQIGTTAKVMPWRTMDDFLRAGEIEGLTVNPDTDEFVVLSNRGSRIVLGMVRGFYEGYDREIHELYVYKPLQATLGEALYPHSTRQGSFLCDGWQVCLNNDGHAVAYKLPEEPLGDRPAAADSMCFDLACSQFKPHCNVANSVVRNGHTYAYVTEWNNERRLFVEDVSYDASTREWRTRLVQTITMDVPDSIAGPGYRDWVADFEKDRLYSFTYLGDKKDNDRYADGVAILEFPLRSTSKGDVCYTRKDILRRAVIPMINSTQDKEIRAGKLYVSAGLQTKKPTHKAMAERARRICVIDLATLSVDHEYSLAFHNEEPEGLDFLSDGRMLLTFHKTTCRVCELPGM